MSEEQVQRAVDDLAAELGLPVLIEDEHFWPLWWSAHDVADSTRSRTIMHRALAPIETTYVKRLRLAEATHPVRTPAIPEADLWARWCVPIRAGTTFLAFLWIIDRDHVLSEEHWPAMTRCADLAADALLRRRDASSAAEHHTARLLERLVAGPDETAAKQLIDLQHLPITAIVVVLDAGHSGGWMLPDGMRAHTSPPPGPALSGPPVPLVHLSTAIHRAHQLLGAIRAGARLAQPTWSAMGAWHLIADAPHDLTIADIHSRAELLVNHAKVDLLHTARSVLELGGEMVRAAAELHVHRTTLYYRLDRIEALTGVDIRTSDDNADLLMALRLAAYRRAF
jgi:hypothetical protein